LIGGMVADVVAETDRRVSALTPWTAADVRSAGKPTVAFSAKMTEVDHAIKAFLTPRMYRHARVSEIMADAERLVRELFNHYMQRPDDLPDEWRKNLVALNDADRARRISDFIAGMTDRFAAAEHARFFDSTPDLR
jgi:dGTPase